MNRVFRLVWSRALGALVVASEFARGDRDGAGMRAGGRGLGMRCVLAAAIVATLGSAAASAATTVTVDDPGFFVIGYAHAYTDATLTWTTFTAPGVDDIALDGSNTFDIGTYNVILGGVLSGPGSLDKQGDGTLTLTGANTYSGLTRIEGGTLVLGGHATYTGGATVLGGTLQLGEDANDAVIVTAANGANGVWKSSNKNGGKGTDAVTVADGASLVMGTGASIEGGDGGSGGSEEGGYPGDIGGSGGNGGIGLQVAQGGSLTFDDGGTIRGGNGGNGGYLEGGGDAGGNGGNGGIGLQVATTGSLTFGGTIQGGAGGDGGNNDDVTGGYGGNGGIGLQVTATGNITLDGYVRGGAGGAGGEGDDYGGAGGQGGTGILFAAGGTLRNEASGKIAGGSGGAGGSSLLEPGVAGAAGVAVRFETSAKSSLTNAGTITGDVQMGDGNVYVTLAAGSMLKGALDAGTNAGGNYTKSLTLTDGTSDAASLGSNVTGFDTLTVDAAKTTNWTLTDTGGYIFNGGVDIKVGTLTLDEGVLLGGDDGVALELGGDGTLDLSEAKETMRFTTLDGDEDSVIHTSQGHGLTVGSGTFAGSIDDSQNTMPSSYLTKTGSGTLTLTGKNYLDAGFKVESGTLDVRGGSIMPADTKPFYGNSSSVADGTLRIDNGGTVYIDSLGFGGNGNVVVGGDGQDSRLTIERNLSIGVDGDDGSLSIDNGGTVKVVGTDTADTAMTVTNGMATVGEGGTLDVDGTLNVGSSITDKDYGLDVEAGGTVRTSALGLAPETHESAHVGIDGEGSRLDIDDADGLVFGANRTAGAFDDPTVEIELSDGGVLGIANGEGTLDTGSAPEGINPAVTLVIGSMDTDRVANPGILDAAGINLNDSSKLVFAHGDPWGDYIFAPVLAGSGTVQVDSGMTTLTGDSSGFEGTLSLSGFGELVVGDGAAVHAGTVTFNLSIFGSSGILLVDGGTLSSDTSIEAVSGSVIGGAGTIHAALTMDDGAMLVVGGSSDTSTLNLDSLTLNDGATLEYDFGAPGAKADGSDSQNTSLDVSGDLTLAGTLNIQSTSDQFGVGVYKIIDYDGKLTDNGLVIGEVPDGGDPADLQVQTSMAGQVNVVVNTPGVTMSYWDGAGPANDGVIQGGAGTWDDSSVNWTTIDGNTNGTWANGDFAVFGGTGGEVALGSYDLSAAGMQFMSNGYVLDGGKGLVLLNSYATPTITVGDGSADSAGYRAVIENYIEAHKGLEKAGAGTLELDGHVNIWDSATVSGGTLQIGDEAGDKAGKLTMDTSIRNAIPAVVVADGAALVVTQGLSADPSGISAGSGDEGDDGDEGNSPGKVPGNGFDGGVAVVLQGTASLDNSGHLAGGVGGSGGMTWGLARASMGALAVDGATSGDGGDAVILASGAFSNHGEIVGGGGGDSPGADAGDISGSGAYLDGADGGRGGDGGNGLRVTAARDLINAGTLRGGYGGDGGHAGFGAYSLATDGSTGGDGGIGGDGGHGGAGVVLQKTATLTNHGDIEGGFGGDGGVGGIALANANGGAPSGANGAGGSGGAGGVGVLFAAGGTLVNAADGVVVGGAGGYGGAGGASDRIPLPYWDDVWGPGSTTNSSAGADGANGVNGYAVRFEGGADSTLVNRGEIDGDVKMGDGNATLGITPESRFGCTDPDGNDVCRTPGTPDIDMGANGDSHDKTLELLAGKASTASYDGRYASSGVNRLQVDAAATAWTLDGDASAFTYSRGIEIDHGVLALGGNLVLPGQPSLELNGKDAALDLRAGGDQVFATLNGMGGSQVRMGSHDLSITGADDSHFAGTLQGSGTLVKNGTGTLNLGGDDSGFTGTTEVKGGRLIVGDDDHADAALGGPVTVAAGATLGGFGTIGALELAGTLSPGNSIGTLHVAGDVTIRKGASVRFEIDPGNHDNDQLDVGGTATIEGGTAVLHANGKLASGTSYTLITAKKGVSGRFDTVDSNFAFLDPVLDYGGNAVTLVLDRNDTAFGDVCISFNQCQVATTVDAVANTGGAGADLQAAIAKLSTLDVDHARATFDRLSGEAHASLSNLRMQGQVQYGRDIVRRMDGRDADKGRSVWVDGYGMSGNLDGDGNAHGADVRMHGVAVGIDTWAGDHWLIGASIGKLRIHGDFAPDDRGQSDLKNLSVYTRLRGDHLFVDGVLSYDWDDNKVARSIRIGDLTRRARANYGSHGAALHLEAGWTWSVGHQRLQPLLSFDHARQDSSHFVESGTGDLSLSGASHRTRQHSTGIGLRWSGSWQAGSWMLRPSVEVRRLHQSLGAQSFAMVFVGAPGDGYAVRGVPLPRYQNLFDVGLLARRGRLDLYLDGSVRTGGGADARSANIGLRWHW